MHAKDIARCGADRAVQSLAEGGFDATRGPAVSGAQGISVVAAAAEGATGPCFGGGGADSSIVP